MPPLLMIAISLIAMIWAANHLVMGTRCITLSLPMSPLLSGLSFVALGIALPELLLLFITFIKVKTLLLPINIVGTNIANIALVLGISLYIHPTTPGYNKLKNTYPILIISMLFIFRLILDGILGKVDGFLFLITAIAVIYYFVYLTNLWSNEDKIYQEFRSAYCAKRTSMQNILSLILGLVLLPISTKFLIIGVLSIVKQCGLNPANAELIVISTILMVPAIISAIIAILQGEEDFGIGIILGVNVCTLLLLLFHPYALPLKVNNAVLGRDLPIMLPLAALLLYLNLHYKNKLSSWNGGILIIIYASYLISLIINIHI